MASFVWGKNGEKLTPDQVARLRIASELMKKDATATTPVASPFAGLSRALQGYLVGRDNKKSDVAETSGLASADAAISGILGGQGGGYTVSTAGQGAPGVVAPVDPNSPSVLGDDTMAALGKPPQRDYLESLIGTESGGNWAAQNSETGAGGQKGHFGRVQFGKARLQEAMNAGAIPQGTTPEQFMASPELQMAAENWHFGDLENQLGDLVGVEVNGQPMDMGALVAMGHLGGAGGARQYVESGGAYNPSDSFGTSLADYARTHGGVSGQPPTYDTAGGAPAVPGGMGGADLASLLALQANPWVTQKYGGVVDALMGQQFDRQNAMWEQEQRTADPMYQAQLEMAQLELDKAQAPQAVDPFAGTKEIGGVLYGPDGQGGFVPVITPPVDPGYVLIAPDEVAAMGLPPGSYQRGPKGEIKQVGGGGTNVTVNNGGSEVGTIPQGYEMFTDPHTGGRSLRPIAGGPEDRAAANAATAANKQTATDVITGAASSARTAAKDRAVGGFFGSVAALNPGSQNAEVYRQVEVLKANASAENIAAMRAASPTGAALGGVSDKDLALLASKSGALDPASPNFERDLDDYERTVLRLVHGTDEGDRIFEVTRDATSVGTPGVDGWTTLPNGIKVRVKQ